MYDTLVRFLGWLNEQPDDMKFYDGKSLCQTCLVGKYAQQTYGRPYLAFDGSKIVQVDERDFLVDGGFEVKVDPELNKFVRRFDDYIGVWEKPGYFGGYAGPFDNITASMVKDFVERG